MNLLNLFGKKRKTAPSIEYGEKVGCTEHVAPVTQKRESPPRWILEEPLSFTMFTDNYNRCIVCGGFTIEDYDNHTHRCPKCYNNFFLDCRANALPKGFSEYQDYANWLQLRYVEKLLHEGKLTEEQAKQYQKLVIQVVRERNAKQANRTAEENEEANARRSSYLKLDD